MDLEKSSADGSKQSKMDLQPTHQDVGSSVNDPLEDIKEKIPFMFSNSRHTRRRMKWVLHCDRSLYHLPQEIIDLLEAEKQSLKRGALHRPLEGIQRRVRARCSSLHLAVGPSVSENPWEELTEKEVLEEDGPLEEDDTLEEELLEESEDQEEEEELVEDDKLLEEEELLEGEPLEEELSEEWTELDPLEEPLEYEPVVEPVEEMLSSSNSSCIGR